MPAAHTSCLCEGPGGTQAAPRQHMFAEKAVLGIRMTGSDSAAAAPAPPHCRPYPPLWFPPPPTTICLGLSPTPPCLSPIARKEDGAGRGVTHCAQSRWR